MKGCRSLTKDEAGAVTAAFRGRYAVRDRALFLLGLYSGLRISELTSVRLGDVFQHGKIVDRLAVRRSCTKGKREGRVILLHPNAKAALRQWLSIGIFASPESPVFYGSKSDSSPITRQQAWRILRRTFSRAGLTGPLGTHSLRKSFASRAWDLLDHDLVKLQKLLGHKQVTSTVSYISFRDDQLDEVVLAM
ncbi:MAG: tyrosine-type recombinase/integrase [Deltaproteobacteria bacterium]|nr:tyrosine-type recombinase/integrase [Deltaproteobacteria bacterium]